MPRWSKTIRSRLRRPGKAAPSAVAVEGGGGRLAGPAGQHEQRRPAARARGAPIRLTSSETRARHGARAVERHRQTRAGEAVPAAALEASAPARAAGRTERGQRDGEQPRDARRSSAASRAITTDNLPGRMFSKVLVANRGEIAIRVMRTLEELGVASVAVYSEPDRDAPHARRADEAYLLGPGPAAESYLNVVDKILEVARSPAPRRSTPATASSPRTPPSRAPARRRHRLHRPARRRDRRDGLEDQGPRADEGGRRADRARHHRPGRTVEDARKVIADSIGYPVAIKAAGGGGGKGFRVAETEDELEEAFEGAAREGEKFFSDATVYVERYLPDPRHVEVQVLADSHGNVIHLFERDCSVQRRHQKLIEESPAPAVDPELRERIGKIGTDAARAVGYRSAGTIEGLLAGRRVLLPRDEHPRAGGALRDRDGHRHRHRARADQDRRGRAAGLRQDDVVIRGHAIECRINAEDASKKFAPAPGRISSYREPAGPFVRVDSGAEEGYEVLPLYDPMIAKLIVWDVDREASTRRMLRALDEYEIGGLKTLIPFHRALLETDQWANGETCRDLVEDRDWLKQLAFPAPEKPATRRRPRRSSASTPWRSRAAAST